MEAPEGSKLYLFMGHIMPGGIQGPRRAYAIATLLFEDGTALRASRVVHNRVSTSRTAAGMVAYHGAFFRQGFPADNAHVTPYPRLAAVAAVDALFELAVADAIMRGVVPDTPFKANSEPPVEEPAAPPSPVAEPTPAVASPAAS